MQLDATGFFRVEQLCDRWWFVTPDGHPFWSAGVNSVNPRGSASQVTGELAYGDAVAARYESDEAWADATVERLHGWGFNTAGSWSTTELLAPRMVSAPNLSLGMDNWQTGAAPDYFDPAWEAAVQARALEVAGPLREEPNLLGWFLDNENKWGPDWRGTDSFLAQYLALPEGSPGRLAAEAAQREPDPETAFLVAAAERYFSVTTAAVRAVDPNHLILGNRDVAILSRPELVEVSARYVDVLSFNSYVFFDVVVEGAQRLSGGLSADDALAAHYAIAHKPVLVSEFGFRAADSGLPNSWPPIYPTLPTQADRASAFEAYVREHQAAPWIVGVHWFAWVDEPVDGRFDGEDNNWGLVSQSDEPWQLLTERAATVLPQVYGTLEEPR